MIINVLTWKFPGVEGIATRDEHVTEFPASALDRDGNKREGSIPSQEELDLWAVEYSAYQDATAYRAKRAQEYPPVGDQLDAMWKLQRDPNDAEALAVKAQVEAVKDKYPKPVQTSAIDAKSEG